MGNKSLTELAAAEQIFESCGSSGRGVEAGMEVYSPSDNGGGGSGVEEIAAAEQMIKPSTQESQQTPVEDISGTLLNLNQNKNQVAAAGMDPDDNAAFVVSHLAQNRYNILVEPVVTITNGSTMSPTVLPEHEHYER